MGFERAHKTLGFGTYYCGKLSCSVGTLSSTHSLAFCLITKLSIRCLPFNGRGKMIVIWCCLSGPHIVCSADSLSMHFCGAETCFYKREKFINASGNCRAFQVQDYSCRLIEKVAESVRYSWFLRLLSKCVCNPFKRAQIPKWFRLAFPNNKRFSISVFAHWKQMLRTD